MQFWGASVRRRLLTLFLALAGFAAFAPSVSAHPHVWATVRSEIVLGPNHQIIAIRHAWTFDEFYTAMAVEGLDTNKDGVYSKEELEPLAKVNVESLKEFDYFTYATADGKKAELAEPAPGYWLDYAGEVLTLNFTLPFKKPVSAKELKVEIYDPTIFVDFSFAKEKPAQIVGAPKCKLDVVLPREMTFAEGKKLSEIPADQPNTTMAWGAQFASRLLVHCP